MIRPTWHNLLGEEFYVDEMDMQHLVNTLKWLHERYGDNLYQMHKGHPVHLRMRIIAQEIVRRTGGNP